MLPFDDFSLPNISPNVSQTRTHMLFTGNLLASLVTSNPPVPFPDFSGYQKPSPQLEIHVHFSWHHYAIMHQEGMAKLSTASLAGQRRKRDRIAITFITEITYSICRRCPFPAISHASDVYSLRFTHLGVPQRNCRISPNLAVVCVYIWSSSFLAAGGFSASSYTKMMLDRRR